MKHWMRLAMAFAVLIPLLAARAAADAGTLTPALGDAPSLETPASLVRAAVMDADTGMLLYGREADAPFSPAGGTVTLMLALTALDMLSPDAEVTPEVSPEVPGYVVRLGIVPGSRWTVRDLLAAMLLYGARDAAVVLADCLEEAAGDPVALMNEKAGLLGMTGTQYVNAVGAYDTRQTTTARDLLLLAAAAEACPELRTLLAQARYETGSGDPLVPAVIVNRLTLLQPGGDYDRRVTGMVVGTASDLGMNGIISARSGNMALLMAFVTDDPAGYAQAVSLLLDAVFEGFERLDVWPVAQALAGRTTVSAGGRDVAVEARPSDAPLTVSAAAGFAATLSRQMDDFALTVDDPLPGADPVSGGQTVSAVLTYRGRGLFEIELIVRETPEVTAAPAAQADEPVSGGSGLGWMLWIAAAGILAAAILAAARFFRGRWPDHPNSWE